MTRIRQLYPNNYQASSQINSEFVNILRYLQATERGSHTLAELMDKIFDENGDFNAAFEFRVDPTAGLQYRVGEYTDAEEGWETIADMEDLRGAPGINIGNVVSPIFHSRLDYVATGGEFDVLYEVKSDEVPVVFKAGLLQREGLGHDYTVGGGNVTFTAPLVADERVTLFKLRQDPNAPITLLHYNPQTNQSVFAVQHGKPEDILVYLDGVLQQEGGAADYVSTPTQNFITFNTPQINSIITIFILDASGDQTVSGFLMAEDYADPTTGLLKYAMMSVADDQIPQAKVNGLTAALASKAVIYVDDFEPTSPVYPSFWLDTSQPIPDLHIYDGTRFTLLTTEDNLPSYSDAQDGRYLRVSPTTSGLEWAVLDLTAYVEKNQIGANSGVASLDLQGRIPAAQMPEVIGRNNHYYHSAGALADGQYAITRLYRSHERISALSLRSESGTCSVTVTVSGVNVGSTYSVSSTPQEFTLGSPIEVNALTNSIEVGINVTAGNAANNVEVVLVSDQLNTTLGG